MFEAGEEFSGKGSIVFYVVHPWALLRKVSDILDASLSS